MAAAKTTGGNPTMNNLTERRDRGAALLDTVAPGWERKIDLETFDITSPCGCVLGQIYGEFYTAALNLSGTGDHQNFAACYEWADQHGFYALSEDEPDDDLDAWSALERSWVDLIHDRIAEGLTP